MDGLPPFLRRNYAPETVKSQVARSVTVVLSKLITQQHLEIDVTLSFTH